MPGRSARAGAGPCWCFARCRLCGQYVPVLSPRPADCHPSSTLTATYLTGGRYIFILTAARCRRAVFRVEAHLNGTARGRDRTGPRTDRMGPRYLETMGDRGASLSLVHRRRVFRARPETYREYRPITDPITNENQIVWCNYARCRLGSLYRTGRGRHD